MRVVLAFRKDPLTRLKKMTYLSEANDQPKNTNLSLRQSQAEEDTPSMRRVVDQTTYLV